MKYFVYIALLFSCGFVCAQSGKDRFQNNEAEKEVVKDSTQRPYAKLAVDTVSTKLKVAQQEINPEDLKSINLDEVILVGPYKFKSRSERRQYLILRRKTKKVWPYAVLAAKRLTTLRERLDSIESSSAKRRYTKVVQHYIEDEFKAKLKKLTKTEGQILVKLMYRQIGETTFDVVKELRSGWRAFWYNVTANFFNISLKEKYDPLAVKEDYFIEHILRRAFQKNQLKNQPPAIPVHFSASMAKWK